MNIHITMSTEDWEVIVTAVREVRFSREESVERFSDLHSETDRTLYFDLAQANREEAVMLELLELKLHKGMNAS